MINFSKFCLPTSALLVSSTLAAGANDYDYKVNGKDWGPDLNSKYSDCVNGKEQSPINLTTSTAVVNEQIELIGYNYYDFPVTDLLIEMDDPAWTVTIPSMNGKLEKAELDVTISDGSHEFFTPRQFHVHAPSEHSVEGKLYDLELHLVHTYKGEANLYGAVIGFFFDREAGGSDENPFLQSLFDSIDANSAKAKAADAQGEADGEQQDQKKSLEVAVNQFLDTVNMKEYWSYDGSFTTPPCDEGIRWSVIKQVQPISQKQLEKITSRLAGDQNFAAGKGNNREVQSLNERTLFYTGDWQVNDSAASLYASLAAIGIAFATLAF